MTEEEHINCTCNMLENAEKDLEKIRNECLSCEDKCDCLTNGSVCMDRQDAHKAEISRRMYVYLDYMKENHQEILNNPNVYWKHKLRLKQYGLA